ncbi:MAG: hypothetical protein U1E76_03670 [Planctomycetota bacterium]
MSQWKKLSIIAAALSLTCQLALAAANGSFAEESRSPLFGGAAVAQGATFLGQGQTPGWIGGGDGNPAAPSRFAITNTITSVLQPGGYACSTSDNYKVCSATGGKHGAAACSVIGADNGGECSTQQTKRATCSAFAGKTSCSVRDSKKGLCSVYGGSGSKCSVQVDTSNDTQSCSVMGGSDSFCSATAGDGDNHCSVIGAGGDKAQCSSYGGNGNRCSTISPGKNTVCSIMKGSKGVCTIIADDHKAQCSAFGDNATRCSTIKSADPPDVDGPKAGQCKG